MRNHNITTFEEVIEELEYLYERVKLETSDEKKEVYELILSQEKTPLLYTIMFLSNYESKHFGIYKQSVQLKQKPDEWLAHQFDLLIFTESIDKQKPGLVGLAKCIEKLAGEVQTDVHGKKFIASTADPTTTLYVEETNTKTIGFTYAQNTNHNYHMLLRPTHHLTTSISGKIIEEIITPEDVKFICEKINELINWAYKTLNY